MSDNNGRRHPGDRLFDYARAQKQTQHAPLPAAVGDHQPLPDDVAARYARRALDAEANTLATTGEGARNDQLNKSAFNLGQLVGAGILDETLVRDRLTTVAHTIGLDATETAASIRSGVRAGKKEPRTLNLTPVPDQVVEVSPDQLAPDTPDTTEVDHFWHANPWHAHIYATAKARRCSPWAVLGVVLARIATIAPPVVVLPPIIGGQASLNLFVGLVGPSGSGKGAAERVAADCIHLPHITTITTGSGEGIGHAYRRRTRDGGTDVVNTAVLFSVPEIDTLSALGNRKGATLMPELRRGWSGEALGFAYADPSRRLLIEPHSYRMCLVAGIQPTRAGALLDDADGGTPQRFLWLPATDRYAPDTPPECPAPLTWREPSWSRNDLRGTHGRMEIPVCATARTTIDAAHLARTRGDGDALDGHLLLNQLKTAAALGLLDGRLEVTDQDWQLADVVVRWSTATRNGIEAALRRVTEARNVARAVAEAERVDVIETRAMEAAHKRVCRNITKRLDQEQSATRSALRRLVPARDRDVFDAAIDDLIRTGQLVEEGEGYGTRYRRL